MTEQYSKVPSTLKIGPPTLKVKDLGKSLDFYQRILGLQVDRRYRDPIDSLEILELGFGGKKSGNDILDPILSLKHDSSAKETPNNFAGLFHFAILVPDRKSLTYAYLALEKDHLQFEGFANHLVSESLYLHDAERNGIEIYRDRPQSEWSRDSSGHVVMDTLPLDLDSVLSELSSEDRNATETFPAGAKIGHMHLRVTNLERSTKFYEEKLGLHVTADWSRFGAMFLAAGSYHHHIGLNVWHSQNGKKHEDEEMGLAEFSINLPASPEFSQASQKGTNFPEQTVINPDGIRLVIKSK